MVVDASGSSKVEPSTELVAPFYTLRQDGRVLIQKGVGCAELQTSGLGETVGEIINRLKDWRKGIRLDKRIGRDLRQCGCIYVELLSQLVGFLLHGERSLGLR